MHQNPATAPSGLSTRRVGLVLVGISASVMLLDPASAEPARAGTWYRRRPSSTDLAPKVSVTTRTPHPGLRLSRRLPLPGTSVLRSGPARKLGHGPSLAAAQAMDASEKLSADIAVAKCCKTIPSRCPIRRGNHHDAGKSDLGRRRVARSTESFHLPVQEKKDWKSEHDASWRAYQEGRLDEAEKEHQDR